KVPMVFEREIASAAPAGPGVRVILDDGTACCADHVVLGTGFRVDVARYPFLSRELLPDLDLVGGYPRLGPGLESSVPGMHFVGGWVAFGFGPLVGLGGGSGAGAPAITRAILGRRQKVARLSYKRRVVLRPRTDLS